MPAPFAIPGYYWDEERQKFFKVEKTGTAPAGAPWSQDQVGRQHKRQKRASAAGLSRPSGSRSAGRQAQTPVPLPVVRALSLPHVAGYYDREVGGGLADSGAFAAIASGRGGGRLSCEDSGTSCSSNSSNSSRSRNTRPPLAATAVAAYASGLRFHGAVSILDEDYSLYLERVHANVGWAAPGEPFTVAMTQPPRATKTPISCMYVYGGDEASGLGVVYTNVGSPMERQGSIKGQYIPRDEEGRIPATWPETGPFSVYAEYQRTRSEGFDVPEASAICYHETSRNMIVTSREVSNVYHGPYTDILFEGKTPIHIFSPEMRSEAPNRLRPRWGLGNTGYGSGEDTNPVYYVRARDALDAVYACAPAPSGSSLLCVVGTGRGLAEIDLATVQRAVAASQDFSPLDRQNGASQITMSWNAEQFAHWCGQQGFFPPTVSMFRPGGPPLSASANGNDNNTSRRRRGRPARPRDLITTVDFLDRHPQIVLAGGRWSEPWLVDLREPAVTRWHRFGGGGASGNPGDSVGGGSRTPSAANTEPNAVAHVRSAGPHRVVAAGLRDTMLLYDLRYIKAPRARSRGSGIGGSSTACPVLRFDHYYNEARLVGTGFAVDAALGLVAVGDCHVPRTGLGGGISLYSLHTGQRLHAPGLDKISYSNATLAREYTPHLLPTARANDDSGNSLPPPPTRHLPRIQAINFASLPGEGPSLFVGVGPTVQKYSIGAPADL
ncbi:hypothetical protein SPI_01038 [Niveomyces insectorum RCEF 264]|uniref:Myocyte-specific enhancer factor 2d n=1 Tax=Niveomyces insectorum RCEF 264 TaxID=1081102 RepID=A0A162JBB1_9HYPO|nr:hypothetical protein SPI_01038 [Niveomyces insectorum RCEF 264]